MKQVQFIRLIYLLAVIGLIIELGLAEGQDEVVRNSHEDPASGIKISVDVYHKGEYKLNRVYRGDELDIYCNVSVIDEKNKDNSVENLNITARLPKNCTLIWIQKYDDKNISIGESTQFDDDRSLIMQNKYIDEAKNVSFKYTTKILENFPLDKHQKGTCLFEIRRSDVHYDNQGIYPRDGDLESSKITIENNFPYIDYFKINGGKQINKSYREVFIDSLVEPRCRAKDVEDDDLDYVIYETCDKDNINISRIYNQPIRMDLPEGEHRFKLAVGDNDNAFVYNDFEVVFKVKNQTEREFLNIAKDNYKYYAFKYTLLSVILFLITSIIGYVLPKKYTIIDNNRKYIAIFSLLILLAVPKLVCDIHAIQIATFLGVGINSSIIISRKTISKTDYYIWVAVFIGIFIAIYISLPELLYAKISIENVPTVSLNAIISSISAIIIATLPFWKDSNINGKKSTNTNLIYITFILIISAVVGFISQPLEFKTEYNYWELVLIIVAYGLLLLAITSLTLSLEENRQI